MAQNIEIPVSLGLQAATDQINKLRELLKNAVKFDTSAFKGLDGALDKAQTQVAKLKSEMSSAFQTTNGTKKFLGQYDKLFESLSAIGERFSFLKETDMIFSPQDAAELKEMRNNLEALDNQIKQIQSGKIGKIFDDSSVDSIREVQEVATQIGVTLSKTTFSEFGQKLTGKMAETKEQIAQLREQIVLLNNAANGAELKKDSIFSQLSMDKLMGNTAEILDKNSARTLREKISSLYEQYGLSDIDLSKTIKSGSNIDQIFVAEEERVRNSTDKYINILQEQKQKIQEEINKFDEGIKQSGGDGKRANWETKLAYIDEIKQKYAGLLTFSDVPDSVLKNGTGITKYIENFKKELQEGLNKLEVSDITRDLQQKVWSIFNSIDGKQVITDASSFKTQVETILKETFGNIDLSDVTNDIKNGMGLDDALDRILVNVKNKLKESGNTEALEQEANKLQAAYDKMARAAETVRTTESSENNSLKDKQVAFEELTQTVLEYVAARLGITKDSVAQILSGDTNAVNNGRSALEQYINSLNKLENKQKTLSSVQTAVTRWMGFYQVLNLTKKAINDMKQHIQELDTVMTSISVVTNFSQEDLWGQISTYSEIARQYGVAIKGVYEVSQIYYQQGLQQNDVMTLTTETLKMARIAGLDYATAADYMTTAIRGFKLEMQDAAHVTDVFSALAATTASSTEEIAVAISKTAASAQAVGASFEATSAMMATMIATTRESATNIGTALKSVISRYGEMTGDPSKTVDSEGEEMSLNRVDKALQTVGITIHDTAGQFRDFDDVILELMEKWDSLDSLSQRYIATLMAGNRQQSRFLALVSNVDEYKKALQTAMDSEGAGQLQTLKTLDSIDAKIEKMKVTIQEFYTSSGLEEMYKGILDTITNVISAANDMPKIFNKLPVQALAIATSLIAVIKNALTVIISNIQASLKSAGAEAQSSTMNIFQSMVAAAKSAGTEAGNGFWSRFMNKETGKVLASKLGQIVGSAFQLWGANEIISGASKYGASTSIEQDKAAGRTTGGGALLSILGSAASGAALGSVIGPLGTAGGAIAGAIEGLVTNIPAVVAGIQQWNVSMERSVELAKKNAAEQKTIAEKISGEGKALETAIERYKQLEIASHSSSESLQEFKDYVNQLGDSYPNLISKMDEQGNYIIELESLEGALASAREKTAIATANATQAELNSKQQERKAFQTVIDSLINLSDVDINKYQQLSSRITQNNLKNILSGISWEDYGKDFEEQIKNVYNTITPNKKLDNFSWNSVDQRAEVLGLFDSIGQLYTNLKKQVENLQTIDPSLSTEFLTGFENISNLDAIQIVNAVDHLRQISQNYIDSYTNIINNTSEILTQQLVNQQLLQLQNDLGTDYNFNYDEYSSLIKTLVGSSKNLQSLGQADNENSQLYEEAVQKETMAYVDFFKTHQEIAQWLNNLDFNQISSYQELQRLLIKNVNDENSNLDELIRQYYLDKYEEYISQNNKIFKDAVASNFTKVESGQTTTLIDSSLYNRIMSLNDESDYLHQDPIALIDPLLNQIQQLLPNYSQMLENTPIMANNYLNGLVNVFREIGKLNGSLQNDIISIITNIDFFDTDSIQTSIEALSSYGEEYKPIIEQLQLAQQMLINNVKIQAINVQQGLSDYAKSVEKIFSNSNKELSYSEALSSALEILESSPDLNLNQLITETENGKFILTNDAISAQLSSITKKEQDTLTQLQNNTKYKISLYKKILEAPEESLSDFIATDKYIDEDGLEVEEMTYQISYNKIQKYLKSNYQGEELSKAQNELENIYNEWNLQDSKTRGTFLDYLINESNDLQSIVDDTVELGKNIESNIAKSYLKSFDYKSIISGKGTTQNQETFKTLLVEATNGRIAEQASEDLFNLLVQGQIDRFNSIMHSLGLEDLQVDKGQANRARFEAFYSAYQKIAGDESPLWNALDKETQDFLTNTAGITETSYTADPAAAAENLWDVIKKFIEDGVASIEEVSETIASKAEQNFQNSNAGKQYNLLTSYKDGFTAQEAEKLGLLDKDGNLQRQFSSVLKQDEKGNYIAQAGQSAASVIQYLASVLKINIDTTSEAYKEAIKSSIDQAVIDADKADIGKQRTQIWQFVMSGKVGDRISLAEADKTTKKLMQSAGLISDISADFVYIQSEKQLNDAITWMKQWLENDTNVQHNPQTARYFQSMVSDWEAKTAKNSVFEGIIGEKVSKSAAEALSLALQNTSESNKVNTLMESLGFKWDQAAQVWNASLETIENTKTKLAEALAKEEITPETYYQLIAKLNDTANAIDPSNKQNNAILNLLQSYTSISEEMRAVFLTNFSKYGSNIAGLFKDNGNGTFSVDPGQLISFLNSVGFEFNEAVQEEIVTISDSYLTNIKNAANYTIQGTTSLVEIDSFRKKYEEIIQEALPENAFQYNNILDAWMLDPKILQNFVRQQALDLVRQGLLAQSEVENYINSQVIQPMAQAVDIKSFLESENQRGLATQNLTTQIQNLQAAVGKRDANYYRNQARAELKAEGKNKTEIVTELYERAKTGEFDKAADEYNEQHKFLQETEAKDIVATLKAGGQAAIEAAQKISEESGKELTSAEIDQLYRNPVKQIQSVIEQIGSLEIGNVVSQDAAKILNATGKVSVSPEGVITSIDSLESAYQELYDQLKNSTDEVTGKALATKFDLNSAYVKVLQAQDQKDIDTKTALDNAAGMTYEAFSDLITRYGEAYDYSLENAINSLSDLGAERTGFGQIRVVDFNKFASRLNLNIDSPEYAEAYSKWVDSMAQLQNQPITMMNNAADQIKNLTTAKQGEAVNVSYLDREMQGALEGIVSQYGATLKDGLLQLGENTDIAGLTSRIAEEAAKAGAIIPEKLGEIRDAVEDMLSNIASLLSNGISGKLNNSQASQLNEWAKQQDEFKQYFQNNDSLTFTRTTDGLKLATAQAIKLYNVIKKTDLIQSGNILKSIMDTDDNYSGVLSTMQRIEELKNKIKEADGTTSSARIEQYQEELALAQDILAVRSSTEDSSFNFMSNSIPGALNNPLNYWQNWIKAMDSLKKGRRSGSMGFQDFYNIINEMGRLAEITGQGVHIAGKTLSNSKEAASLIAQAASALKNVNGEVKVDFKVLSKMGWDFNSNAEGMNKDIEEGIHKLADSQISLIEAMIELLKVVVAMEKLQDVDTDMDMHIDFNEVFEVNEKGDITGFKEGFEKWKESILDQINKETQKFGESDLQKLLQKVSLDGISLYDLIMKDDINWWNDQGKDFQERFVQMLDAFYQAAMSGSWDLENYEESFKQELLSKLPDGVSLDLGSRTFYITGDTLWSIDWNNKEALELFKKREEVNDDEIRQKVLELIKERENPKISAQRAAEIDYSLALAAGQITITQDKKSKKYTGTYNGHTVTGSTIGEVEKQIEWIIKSENAGFTVTVDSEGNISGVLRVGNARIKVTKENGADVYEAVSRRGSQKFFGPHGKEHALGWLASQGEGEQGTYSFGGQTYNVFIDEKTQNTYSIDNDGKFHADGFTFDSYEELLKYFTFKDQTKGSNYEFTENGVTAISVNGRTQVTWNKDGTISYQYRKLDGSWGTFASPEDYEEYLKAYKQPGATLTNNNGIQYKIEGGNVTVTVDDEGNIHYHALLDNGHTVDADDETSFQVGCAAAAALSPRTEPIHAEDVKGKSGKKGINYTVDGQFSVQLDADGAVVSTTEGTDTTLITAGQEKLKEIYKDKEFEANATKVKIDPTDATVTLTEAILKLTDVISEGLASKITVKTDNTTEKTLDAATIDVGDIPNAKGTVNNLELTLSEKASKNLENKLNIPVKLDTTLASKFLNNFIKTITDKIKKTNTTFIAGFDSTVAAKQLNQFVRTVKDKIEGTTPKAKPGLDTKDAEDAVTALTATINTIADLKPQAKPGIDQTSKTTLETDVTTLTEKINSISALEPKVKVDTTAVSDAAKVVQDLIDKLNAIPEKITFTVTKQVETPDDDSGEATGNVGLAKAAGTLMGELGPELVVSKGRYFVVGQNGPEFVNLADDAIVFNHLQTEQLLNKGMSNTRGRAVTNERNAIAYAQGNLSGGPAMASASDMLAYLQQLLSMWKRLKDLSIKDLTSTGGGGGGGGKKTQQFLKDVERWYNLLQKIAELEEKINYEEQRRKLLSASGIKNGKAYYASLKQSLAALKESVEANAQLSKEQKEYFEKRRKELNENGLFRKFYEFDERGQLQFKNFKNPVTVSTKDEKGNSTGPKTFTSAFELLNEINKKDAAGNAVYSTEEQLNMFKKVMTDSEYKAYYNEVKAAIEKEKNKDKKPGEKKEKATKEEILEAFWAKMEGDKTEMQSLHDSIQDYQKAVLEAQEKQAQIIKEMKDNQLAVEKDVYDAIVDMRERAIDEMKDLKDAYEDSTDKFITGLTNALDKERKMYETQQAESDLDKKRRRVAILQRTGGSGAEIASLQAEIESDEQDLYFEKQQQEIDAIEEAAEKQIEKLEQQIELEEELLEYQKEHGLLWQDVSKIMRGTSEEIVSFITTNNSEWWAKSPLATAQDLEDALFKAEQWTQFRDDDGKYFEEILAAIQRVAEEGKEPQSEQDTGSGTEYDKKEGSKTVEEQSTHKLTYTDEKGVQQTRYFRSAEDIKAFKKKHKKDKYTDYKTEKLGPKKYWVFAHKLNWKTGDEPDVFGPYTDYYADTKVSELKKNVYYDDQYVKKEEGKEKKDKDGKGTGKYKKPKKPQGYSEGGLNTETGLAMLHGTPKKPEAIFNAKQTEVLRNDILSNKPTSLMSLLQSLRGAMAAATNNTTNITRSAATEIGSIALNMNVSKIANDYDAKRAGEQAMAEMLRIARKTNVTSIRG